MRRLLLAGFGLRARLSDPSFVHSVSSSSSSGMQSSFSQSSSLAASGNNGGDGSTVAVVIDGSKGEGGGQILRNSISYAGILQKELRVHHIRAGRSKPGLRAQHATCLQLAAQVCGGTIQGNTVGSSDIDYIPSHSFDNDNDDNRTEHTLTGDIGTAGSICLLMQAALPCALLGTKVRTKMVLKGGTNASMAPQYDYWERVFWKTLCQRCELRSNQVQAKVLRRGFYPQGGGEVHVTVEPLNYPLRPVQLTDRGDVSTVYIRSFHAGKLPRHLAEGMAKSAKSYLQQRIKDIPITVEVVTERQAVGSGMGLLCVATTTTGCLLAGSALSSPKKKARDVGIEAAEELFSTLQDGGCVDEWLQDQLILYAALADGVSEILTGSLTLHTKTAVWVAEEMCGATFEITKLSEEGDGRPMDHDSIYGKDGRIPGKHLIRCHGIGFGP